MTSTPREKRRHPRVPVTRRGVIVAAGGKTHACLIVDLSIAGAKVELIAHGAPDGPLSLIDRTAGASHDLKVVWRKGPILGVAFTSTTELPA